MLTLCQGGCFRCVVLLQHQGPALSSTSHLHQKFQASLQRTLLCSSFFSGVKLLLKGGTPRGRDEGVIICFLQQLARIWGGTKEGFIMQRKLQGGTSGTVGALSPGVVMKALWGCSSQEGSDLPAPSGRSHVLSGIFPSFPVKRIFT